MVGSLAADCAVRAHLAVFGAWVRPGPSVFGVAVQELDRVAEDGNHRLERLRRAVHAPRHVEDERLSPYARDAARERRHRRARFSGAAHQLADSRHLVVDEQRGRLWGDVARAEPGAARGDHEVGTVDDAAVDELQVHAHARQRQRMAKRDQVRGLFRGHDPGHTRDLERIAFGRPLAHRAHRLGRHTHHAFGGRLAHSRDLVGDVDHARGPFVVDVGETLGHGHQDMRMPDTDGVLFDYGRTLVTFDYPTDELLRVLREFRPRIAAALGVPAPEAETILHEVLLPMETYVESRSEDEVDYAGVYRDSWRRAGLRLPDGLLHEILDAEQRCWDRAVRVDRDALTVLSWLRDQGIKLGVCSNAPFPPAMMRRQVTTNGIAELVDAIVFSSEVGRRKPAPEVYQAALDAVGTDPDRTLFVGDRVRADYEGPRALGMRAVVVTAHADEVPPDGVPTIHSLADLPSLL